MRGAKVETKNIDQRHQVNSYWHINKAHVSNLVDTLKVDIAPETAQNCALIHVFKYRKTRLIVITSLIFCLVGCSQRSANYTVIHAFNVGERGGGPMGGLLMGNNGNLYGTTAFDGTNHDGTVFKIATNGKETILYSFKCGTDGVYPKAGLVMDSTGSLYGTTSEGGTSDAGTVFKITPAGKKITLYDFKGGSDGADPEGRLVMGRNGNFYGTTSSGGNGNGTVFEITTNGKESILYRFKGDTNNSDGSAPEAGLVWGLNGNLYGTTSQGGPDGLGTIFMISPTGKERILYSFKGDTDGASPEGPLLMGPNGNFYGTASQGGTSDAGTVFKITPTGKIRILYSFKGGTYGENPKGGLIFGSDANLFGTTTYGGNGVVFEVTPQGSERILHTFGDGSKGACPETGLVISRRGNLYGTTPSGGAHLKGVIFKIRT